MIKKITIIGSGNIANQLGRGFFKKGIQIQQVLARNVVTGKKLANNLNSQLITDIKKINISDLIIICVNDDNIKKIVQKLPNYPMVHTSGNTSINVFKGKQHYGVIYPIQSIKKETKINFQKIPICIEANSNLLKEKIRVLSNKLSNQILIVNSKKRKYIHLSAVLASNFSNYCYIMAYNILQQQELTFDILKPLIEHTAKNSTIRNPKLNQTGPAIRDDKETMKIHLRMLKNKNYKKIYKLLSHNILKEYEK